MRNLSHIVMLIAISCHFDSIKSQDVTRYLRKRARRNKNLRSYRQKQKLVAFMSDYPVCDACNADGNPTEPMTNSFPRGMVEIHEENGTNDIWIRINMRGLPSNCSKNRNDYPKNGCGIHIHEGNTCSSPNLVKGHLWDKNIFGEGDENDPWIKYNGENTGTNGPAIQFESSLRGDAIDQWIYLRGGNGYRAEENLQRAVVIHDENGARISCGVLNWEF